MLVLNLISVGMRNLEDVPWEDWCLFKKFVWRNTIQSDLKFQWGCNILFTSVVSHFHAIKLGVSMCLNDDIEN